MPISAARGSDLHRFPVLPPLTHRPLHIETAKHVLFAWSAPQRNTPKVLPVSKGHNSCCSLGEQHGQSSPVEAHPRDTSAAEFTAAKVGSQLSAQNRRVTRRKRGHTAPTQLQPIHPTPGSLAPLGLKTQVAAPLFEGLAGDKESVRDAAASGKISKRTVLAYLLVHTIGHFIRILQTKNCIELLRRWRLEAKHADERQNTESQSLPVLDRRRCGAYVKPKLRSCRRSGIDLNKCLRHGDHGHLQMLLSTHALRSCAAAQA